MALSLCQYPNFSDLQAFFEPQSKTSNNSTTDFYISNYNNNNNNSNNSTNNNINITLDNQMEYNSNVMLQNSTIGRNFDSDICQNHRNTENSNNDGNNSNVNNFNDYEQVIHFVDSPPNSKESWPGDYNKESQRSTILNVNTIYSNNINRKRRMDWEAIDITPESNGNKSPESVITPSKVPNIDNKHHEKKKSAGRASWADDIDFDLNGDFSNNSYLNNAEPFLFSPGLSALKQEIPSPNAADSQANVNNQQRSGGNKSPSITTTHHQVHNQIVSNSSSQNNESKSQQDNNDTNNINNAAQNQASQTNNSHQGIEHQVQQQQQQQQQQKGSPNSPRNNNLTTTNFHHILQQDTNLDTSNSRQSPNQVDPLKTDNTNDDAKFQYILAAATSIATKSNEETLTYLNQGQSYEIKLKKIGDLSFYRDKLLKSVIKICFHERRLQYMEREQMQLWQASRPGERIIEVDVPLSYGIIHVTQSLNSNTVEVLWDPMKEIGVYIKVNCISTEFTPKKHGGEKGVPFRIQIETYLENTTNNNNNNNNNNNSAAPLTNISNNNTTNTNNSNNSNSNNNSNNNNNTNNNTNQNTNNNISTFGDNLGKPIHAAACQIKVFKLKGADRKHKQDREKIQRRPPSEQEKYQPSYECTILNDIPLDALNQTSAGCYSPEYMKIWPNSPVHMPKYEGMLPFSAGTGASSPIAINNVTSTNPTNNLKLMEQNMVSPQHLDMDEYTTTISKESSPNQVAQWLTYYRLNSYLNTFAQFSGSDILRMSKEDLIQVCGLADGIRMFNTLHSKRITPRLTIYVSLDGNNYNAIYLISNTVKELTQKLFKLPGFLEMISNSSGAVENSNGYSSWGMLSKYSGSGSNIYNDASKLLIFITGPSGIHVMVSDEVLNNAIKDESLFTLETQNGKILMKNIIKTDNNIN